VHGFADGLQRMSDFYVPFLLDQFDDPGQFLLQMSLSHHLIDQIHILFNVRVGPGHQSTKMEEVLQVMFNVAGSFHEFGSSLNVALMMYLL